MFDSRSRYYSLDVATISVPDENEPSGTRDIRYVRRRIIPPGGNLTTLVEHTVAQGERLDQITARYLGDPTQFWRVCDANEVIQPEELEETSRVIRIALPNM